MSRTVWLPDGSAHYEGDSRTVWVPSGGAYQQTTPVVSGTSAAGRTSARGSARLTLSLSAAGRTQSRGAAGTAANQSLVASGRSGARGTAAASLSISMAAVGRSHVSGAATASLLTPISVSATGLTQARGAADATTGASTVSVAAIGLTVSRGYAQTPVLVSTDTTGIYKLSGADVVEFDANYTTAFKTSGAVIVETTFTTVFKIAGVVILESEFVPLPRPPHTGQTPHRCPVGMAEYTETTGLFDGYKVKGAIPGWETLRSQLRDHEYVRYRVTNSQKEEVGEGWFDWRGNTLVRTRFIVPSTGIDWGPGRKILTIIEDYTNDVCEGAVIANSPLSIGIAEHTETTGVGPYKLKGALREFFTLRGRLPDGARVRYRATNIAKEEVSEGIFDAVNNQLIRNQAVIPTVPINWGPGRKLIYIIEK